MLNGLFLAAFAFVFARITGNILGKQFFFFFFPDKDDSNFYLDNKKLIVHRKGFRQLGNLNIITYEHGAFIAVKINHFSTSSC